MSIPNDRRGGGKKSRAKVGTKKDRKASRLAADCVDNGHV